MTTNVFLVGQRHQLRPGTEPLWQAYSGFYVALKHPMGREFSRCIDGMVEGGITQVGVWENFLVAKKQMNNVTTCTVGFSRPVPLARDPPWARVRPSAAGGPRPAARGAPRGASPGGGRGDDRHGRHGLRRGGSGNKGPIREEAAPHGDDSMRGKVVSY